MHRFGDKLVGKLSKSFGQVLSLPTLSTYHSFVDFSRFVLSGYEPSGNTQFSSRFTQAFLANSNLLSWGLCPLSTRTINNTNLIKEL
jgi:hypothetical protein